MGRKLVIREGLYEKTVNMAIAIRNVPERGFRKA